MPRQLVLLVRLLTMTCCAAACGASARHDPNVVEHKKCSCGKHFGCNPCTCTNNVTTIAGCLLSSLYVHDNAAAGDRQQHSSSSGGEAGRRRSALAQQLAIGSSKSTGDRHPIR
ncbi:unnamed protein product [Camellia sinensis]